MAYQDHPKDKLRHLALRCPQCNTTPTYEQLSVDRLGLAQPGVSWTCAKCECIAFAHDNEHGVAVTLRQPFLIRSRNVNNTRYRQ